MLKTVGRKWIIASAFLLLSCGGCVLNKDYVKADQATFDAIAPEYRAYVESDAKLDADQKTRRLRTLESWKVRLQGGQTP